MDPKVTREQLGDYLRDQRPQDPEALLCESVDLAVRLWLMVDIGELRDVFVSGRKPLLWEQGVLKDLLEERFGLPTGSPERVVRVKLDRIFNARNLERVAGL